MHNAIIHSDAKTIKLSAETLSDDGQTSAEPLPESKRSAQADSPGVKITVNDDGTGIDPEILPNIFERGISGKEGGSGIGLSICREIAELHGGGISVQSKTSAGNKALAAMQETGTRVTVILRGLIGLKSGRSKEESNAK